jgi:hypothetical protein
MVERIDITELSDAFLRCRARGHDWDDFEGEVRSDLFKLAHAVEMVRCTRCKSERFFYLGADMKPFAKYYRKPKGYDTIVGQGTRPNARIEMFRRGLLAKGGLGRRRGRNG